MTGADLKCPECGAGAKDVDPNYNLDPVSGLFPTAVQAWTMWHCKNGHRCGLEANVSSNGTSFKTVMLDP